MFGHTGRGRPRPYKCLRRAKYYFAFLFAASRPAVAKGAKLDYSLADVKQLKKVKSAEAIKIEHAD